MVKQVPNHIAVIMDGNGRWARSRNLPRVAGHKKGAVSARSIVKNASELGVSYVTLFGFSSENWNRPADEVKELMNLLRFYLRSEMAELHKNGARLRVIGSRVELDDDIVELIDQAETLTQDNKGICVVIALNYGGRNEILAAAQRMADLVVEQGSADNAQSLFEQSLYTHDIPDPDLIIRTSGEQRISNFLLWQCAYSEFIFTPTLWPDFDKTDLQQALDEYAQRDRRYGALSDDNHARDNYKGA